MTKDGRIEEKRERIMEVIRQVTAADILILERVVAVICGAETKADT